MPSDDPIGQARKLGLVEGVRVLLVGAPPDWSLADPPAAVDIERLNAPFGAGKAADPGAVDLMIVFAHDERELDQRLGVIASSGAVASPLWICWPRRAGGHESGLTDGIVRRAGLALGLVDNKVAAVDADWSGLRFVRRGRR